MEAIAHGLTILSWFENNAEKDLPPENIWDDAEGLELHWKAVRQREADRSANGGSSSDDDDDEPGSSDMLGNDLADVFKD
jgi:hypothetical protein